MTNLSIDQIIRSIYGKDTAEQVAIAKDCGIKPDADGLLEFPKPVNWAHDDELDEELPIFELVSVEDVEPLSADETTREEEREQAAFDDAEATASVSTTASTQASAAGNLTPYLWHTGTHPVRSFGMWGEYWLGSYNGMMGRPIRQVRLQHASGIYRARTYYYAYPYPYDSRQWSQWSPYRKYEGTPRILGFSSTVYARAADVYWWY